MKQRINLSPDRWCGHQDGNQSVGHEASSGGSKIAGSGKEETGCEQSSGNFPCEMTLSPDDSCDDDVLDYKSLTTGHEPFC